MEIHLAAGRTFEADGLPFVVYHKHVVIHGNAAVLDGLAQSRIFLVHFQGVLELQNLSLTAGSATATDCTRVENFIQTVKDDCKGGCVLVQGQGSSVTMTGVEMTGCYAQKFGGGICVEESVWKHHWP